MNHTLGLAEPWLSPVHNGHSYSFPLAFISSDKVIGMTSLQDNIYGREIATGIRKSQVVIGRGGSGNARKSISSASTISSVSSTSTPASRFLGSLASRGTAAGSDRTRRWSSASGDFTSVINISQEVGDSDRYDLYTISSHSTSTNESGVLSDVPSYISEYTFKTSSNPSAKSRPSTMSSNPSRQSGQSDWIARIPRTYSSESLPPTISESVEASMTIPAPHNPTIFRNPFGNISSRSLAVYPIRRRSDIAPFDDDDGASINEQQQYSPGSKSTRRFRMFRKMGPRIDTQLNPPTAYPSSSRFGQSNETVNIRNISPSSADSPTNRRNSNPLARGLLLRVGSRGDN